MKEGERIKDNNSSPHGFYFHFYFVFSNKFNLLTSVNFVSYGLCIYPCGTHSEPGLPVVCRGLFESDLRRDDSSLFQALGSRGREKTWAREKNERGLWRGWKGRERACKDIFNEPLPPTLGLMRCLKLQVSTCQLAGNACLLSGLRDSCVS